VNTERERRWNHIFSPEVKWQLFNRFVLRGKYNFSYFYIENQIKAGVSFYVSSSLRLDYDYSYGNNDYLEDSWWLGPEGDVILIQRNDIYDTHKAGAAVVLIIILCLFCYFTAISSYLRDYKRNPRVRPLF